MKRRKTLAAGLGISLGIYLAGHGAVGAVCWLIIAAAGVFLLLSVRGYSHAVTLFFLFAVLGVCLMNVNIEAYHSRDVNNQTVTVSGIMTDTENVLRNCEINGEDVPGKIEITLPYQVKNNKKITTGSEVFFLCKLGDYTVDKDGIRTTEYKNGLRYYTTEMLSWEYDEARGCYVASMELSNVGTGKVSGYSITVVDTYSNYVTYDTPEDFWFETEGSVSDVSISEFYFPVNGKTLTMDELSEEIYDSWLAIDGELPGEVESLFFCIQTGLGVGVLAYGFGYLTARKKYGGMQEPASEPEETP